MQQVLADADPRENRRTSFAITCDNEDGGRYKYLDLSAI
jgi:hypothetical protein